MTITKIIARAVSSRTTGFSAQRGVFFDGMADLIETLEAAGHKTQQSDGERVLVDHAAWVTKHGVVHPL